MQPPFRLGQHPRRAVPPLSGPPPGYFEQLPTRLMARVAEPARRPLAGLWAAPAALRTGLASAVLLGTFAATLWLGGSAPLPPGGPTPTAALNAVPPQQLVEYLTSGETSVELLDLAELPTRQLTLPRYLHATPAELTEALDAQPTEEEPLL